MSTVSINLYGEITTSHENDLLNSFIFTTLLTTRSKHFLHFHLLLLGSEDKFIRTATQEYSTEIIQTMRDQCYYKLTILTYHFKLRRLSETFKLWNTTIETEWRLIGVLPPFKFLLWDKNRPYLIFKNLKF